MRPPLLASADWAWLNLMVAMEESESDIVALLDPRELVWSRACLTLSNWIYDGGCISVPSNGTFKDVGLVLGD